MIVKEFKDEFYSAYTLDPSVVCKNDNGWEIKAEIVEDYYEWINYFEAKKGKMWVKGDFEDKVYASSKKAYEDFRKYFNPQIWDYYDI